MKNKQKTNVESGAKCLLLTIIFLLLSVTTYAQQRTIKGSVYDDSNQPVIGASVTVKGSTVGTITDLDGLFSIQAKTTDVLEVAYIGYLKQAVPLKGKTEVKVVLNEDNQLLDEVVVVGYGVQKKSDVTGAMARVGEKELNTKPVSNALEALQGKVAGVDITSSQRPGELGTVRIRGQRSISATSNPLYVVDGVPLESGGIEAINPRDIEAIDILKDASATAIYGSRGANGVVLVTTKRGKVGSLSLNYSGSFTFEKMHDLAPKMNASDYITWRRWAYHNANPTKYNPGDQPSAEQDKDIFYRGLDATGYNNVMRGWASGTWDPSKVLDTDWTDFVTQTGVTQEHSLSASGGTENMRSFISFGYLKNEGTQKGQEYERYNTSISTDITAVPWFTLGGSVNASWAKQDYGYSRTGQTGTGTGPTDIYGAASRIYRYAEPYDEEGKIIQYPGGESIVYSIMDEWKKSSDRRQTLRLLGNVYGRFDFGKMWNKLDGLTYKISFGPDFRYHRAGAYIDSNSVSRLGGANWARWQYNRKLSWTLDNLINYTKTINQHRFDVTLLQSASSYNEESADMAAENIPKASFKWYNMGAVDLAASSSKASMGTGLAESSMTSYMARLNYAFSDKYLMTVSGRYDGASMLAKGNKWDFFPSMALAWRMEQENFMQDISWIDQMKLRFGYGVVGNSSVGRYATLGNIQSYYVPFGGSSNQQGYATNEPYYTKDQVLMANPDLSWERTTQLNYGIDFSLFKGRVGGSLELYTSRTKDLLLKMKIPTLTGYGETWANIGETKNLGVEMSVNVIPVLTRDFRWNTNVNAAYQKDEIVELMNGKENMIDNWWLIGESINVFYGYANAGLWQESDAEEMAKFNANGHKFEPGMTKPVDQDGDYKITAADRVVLGNKTPRWTIGWGNTFNYKGIELSVELYGRLGYMTEGGEGQDGIGNQRELDYWTPTNTNAEWQKPIYSTSGGDAYSNLLGYKKASFIKFRNVSLGYVFSNKICKTLGISNLKVYGQLKNPGTLYSSIDYKDLDMDASYYNRGFTLGIQIGF